VREDGKSGEDGQVSYEITTRRFEVNKLPKLTVKLTLTLS